MPYNHWSSQVLYCGESKGSILKGNTSISAHESHSLRVMHILPHIKNVGNGIVNATVDLAARQAENGMTVVIASRGGGYEEILENAGVVCESLDINILALGNLRKLVKKHKPSIIHCHTPRTFLFAKLCFPFRKIVATAHNEFSRSTFFLIFATKIIAVSDHNGNEIQKWAGRRRVTVVKNGPIDGIRSQILLPSPEISMKHPAILFVGGMYERKGISDLLFAFKLLPNDRSITPHLYLVGAGPDQEKFERIAKDLKLGDSVTFVGFVPDPTTMMNQSDVFVLPSKQEPFGLVLAEARHAGCAIVGTAVGGIPELLDNGLAGMLVESGDVSGLSKAIHLLISNDDTRREWANRSKMNTEWLSVQRVTEQTSFVYSTI